MKFNATAWKTALLSVLTFNISIVHAEERWFEMEVILFQQLDDKKKLKEVFSDENTDLPNYRLIDDLLTPYLYPEISQLKKQLPVCVSTGKKPVYEASLINQSTLPALFEEKSLHTISTTFIDENENGIDDISEAFMLDSTNGLDVIEPQIHQTNEISRSQDTTDTFFDDNINAIENTDTLSIEQHNNLDAAIELTEEQIQLVNKAKETFQTRSLNLTNWYFSSSLCQLPDTLLSQYQETHPDYNIDHFSVDNLTGVVNGIEFLNSNKPYLISSDSLQLKDVSLQLRRSRNFKPLLHLGWRQAAVAKNKASAMRIFAGDNFDSAYQQALTQYKNALVATTNNLINITDENEHDTALVDTPESAFNKKVKTLVLNAQQQPQTLDQIIDNLDKKISFSGINDLNNELTSPTEPLQPWFLEGFFRVHLKHYLYITADFNIASKTLGEQSTEQLQTNTPAQWQLIPFRQNRRVISGEIHYFDHPYMGMIVQIRRYEKPEPTLQESN